ncbi:LuxR C-terminal-related transcriptional regulator [uncultured Vagococcus sp.]|uniref:LuxR C-terminal-related transcriptional regulator n=1 Tax=uncultured Vagococcus sp. TaxID=189676 RepID=UPI0028D6E34A|nr:LuxR C-terminal-related transcriptional regulator [uncultured Vagococcus sp.]
MNKKYIQNEKLLFDTLPVNFLPRRHIIHALNDTEDKRIILFQAPGGYGKTSSTVHWLNNRNEPVLWVSLDEYDNLPTLFYKLCSQALLGAQPDNCALAEIVNHSDFPSSPVEFMILALAAFKTEEQPYTMVLDDFHFITNPKILKSLPFVLKRLSLSTKIILLSRAAMPLEIEEHYRPEKILKLTAEDLAFTKDEIVNFYHLMGKPVSSEEIGLIYTQTNGWPIAIQSLAVSPVQLTSPLNQTNRLATFIEGQMWEKWPTSTQDFLLKLSIVGEITSNIACLLTENTESDSLLRELSSQSMLIHQTNENSYRFHHLFQDFLRGKLQAAQHLNLSSLYQTLTRHYLEIGDIFNARHAAINSLDENLMIASLMNTSKYIDYKTSIEEYVDTVLKFQAQNLPLSIYEREPSFHIIPAWYYYLTGKATKMSQHVDQLLIHFEQIATTSPLFIPEIILILGLDPRQPLLEKINAITQVFSLPEKLPKPENSKELSLTLQLPFLHRGLLDYSELANEVTFLAVRPHFEVLLQDQADETLDCVYGGLQLERNDLITASQYIYQALSKVTDETNHEFYFSISMHLLQLHYLSGDDDYFRQSKNQLKQWLKETNNYYLYPNFAAFNSRLAIWEGDQQQADAWLKSYYVTEVSQIELYKFYQHLTTIRAHILLDHRHEALLLSERMLRYTQDFKRPADEAEVTVLQAIVYWRLGNQKQALKMIEDILNKSLPFHFVRIFADEGAAILPILKKLKNQLNQTNGSSNEFQHYLSEIILVATQVSLKRSGILPPMSTETVRLSKQQLRMVELLAAGHKFNEIVDITGLSINTIRAHVNLAYQKLGVNNSKEAVLKAKELKVIA